MSERISLRPATDDIRTTFVDPLETRINYWKQFSEMTDAASSIIPGIATEIARAKNYEPEPLLWERTTDFFKSISEQSSMPPVNFTGFMDQVITSQASGGEIPLVLEGIACLNYPPRGSQKELGMQPLFPIEKTGDSRWPRFEEEIEDFLRACNEIGVRPLLLFGVHDLLNFSLKEGYFGAEDVLERAIKQNVTAMDEGIIRLNTKFKKIDLAHPNLRPSTTVFTHSDLLSDTGVLRSAFDEHLAFFTEHPELVDSFRDWLMTAHPEDVSDMESRDPKAHKKRLSKIVALYAADKMNAARIATHLFPGEHITDVTQLSLQPSKTSEWVLELASVHSIDTQSNVVQLSPFNNAGSWSGTHRRASAFSAHAIYKGFRKRGTSGFIRYLINNPEELAVRGEQGNPAEIPARAEQLAKWVCGSRSTEQAIAHYRKKVQN